MATRATIHTVIDDFRAASSSVERGEKFEKLYRVQKMRCADKTTKKAIICNGHITRGPIPARPHRCMLGSLSTLEWLIGGYPVKMDKDSGIVNDLNDCYREHRSLRDIVDLIKQVTRVSVDTMRIVDALSALRLGSSTGEALS